jgi:hypothetical protein
MSRSTNDEGKIAELLGIPKEHAREILKSPPAEPRKTYSREEEIFGALMEGNKNLREKFEALSDAEKSRAYDRMAEAYAEFLSTPIKKAHTEYQDLKKKHETAQAERKTELQKLEHAAELAKRMERSLTTTNASVVSEARKKVAAASNELRKALGLSPKSHGYVPKPEVYEHRPERKLVLPKGKQDPGKLSDKAYPKAKAELAELQSGAVARAEDIASRIKVAEKKKRAAKLDVEEMIALGDLSENAAYSEAKERLAEADAEINSLIQEASPETLRERINFLKQRIADFEKRK